MKKAHTLTLIIVLLLLSTMPSLAASAKPAGQECPPETNRARTYALAGYITSIDAVNKIVSVSIVVGNRWAKPCIGSEIPIYTTSNTIYKRSGGGAYSFDRLAVGQSISSRGYLANGKYTARRITVGALLLKTR